MGSRVLLIAASLVLSAGVASAQFPAPDGPPPPPPGAQGQPGGGRNPLRDPAPFTQREGAEKMQRLRRALGRPVSIDMRDHALSAALRTLSDASGIRIRAADDFGEGVRLTVKFDNVPLARVLEIIATQTSAIIRPNLDTDAIVLARHPNPGPQGAGHWAPEWGMDPRSPGARPDGAPFPGGMPFPGGQGLRLPPSMRLTPSAVTALDATHFVVLSLNPTVGNPVRVGEGEGAVTVVMPMAILTLYQIEDGQIKQVSSALHQIPDAEVQRLLQQFRPVAGAEEPAPEKP